jgi:hypothetical protein
MMVLRAGLLNSRVRWLLCCAFFVVVLYATIPDYGKRSVRHYIDYKFPSAVFAITDVGGLF